MSISDEQYVGHDWHITRCVRCGMQRHELWVLDVEDRAVMALVWADRAGRAVRTVEFAWMVGSAPSVMPRSTLAEAFPGVPVGAEPVCRPE